MYTIEIESRDAPDAERTRQRHREHDVDPVLQRVEPEGGSKVLDRLQDPYRVEEQTEAR